MAPGRLLLRVHGGPKAGSGHVMRCLALAQSWRQAGGRAHFAATRELGALRARISGEGFALTTLGARAGSLPDARATAREAARWKADWIALDGYVFGSAYQKLLKVASPARLLVVDDHGRAGRYHADLILDHSPSARAATYARRPRGCRLLLGPRYFLLRREFWRYRSRKISAPRRAARLLVTMGGADPRRLLARALAAARAAAPGATIVAAAGVYVGRDRHLARAARAADASLLFAARNMAAPMAASDAALSAGGTAASELAFLGVPSLLVAVAPNQRPVVKSLAAAGAALDLGPAAGLTAGALTRRLAALLSDWRLRGRMSRRGRRLVDGRGGERVVRACAA